MNIHPGDGKSSQSSPLGRFPWHVKNEIDHQQSKNQSTPYPPLPATYVPPLLFAHRMYFWYRYCSLQPVRGFVFPLGAGLGAFCLSRRSVHVPHLYHCVCAGRFFFGKNQVSNEKTCFTAVRYESVRIYGGFRVQSRNTFEHPAGAV